MLTGEVGCGKTTVISLASHLNKNAPSSI